MMSDNNLEEELAEQGDDQSPQGDIMEGLVCQPGDYVMSDSQVS